MTRKKQKLIDWFAQKLLIDGIHSKQVTGDADMLIVKEALFKVEKLDRAVVHSRDTEVFVAFSHHLDGSEMQECLPFAHVMSGRGTVSAT